MEKVSRTKKFIAENLLTMCKSVPLRKITIQDIADQCEINRGTFYYHFKDKQDLINYVYHIHVTVPLRKLFARGVENWEDLTLNSLKFMYQDRDFYIQAFKIVEQNDLPSFILEEVKENWRIITKMFLEYTYGDVEVNYKHLYYLSDYFASGAFSMMKIWVSNGMQESPEEVSLLLDMASNNGLGGAIALVVEMSQ